MKRSMLSFYARLAALGGAAALLSATSGQAVAAACTQADVTACHQVCGPMYLYNPTWQQCFQSCMNSRCSGWGG